MKFYIHKIHVTLSILRFNHYNIAIIIVGESLVQRAVELSGQVMSSTGPEGQESLRQEISQLKSDWEGLRVICKDTQKVLAKCITAWSDFATTYDTMKNWLDDFQVRVNAELETEKKTPEDLQKCRVSIQFFIFYY